MYIRIGSPRCFICIFFHLSPSLGIISLLWILFFQLLFINRLIRIIVTRLAIFILMCLISICLFKIQIWYKFIVLINKSINFFCVNRAFIVCPYSFDVDRSPEYLESLIMNRYNLDSCVHFVANFNVGSFFVHLLFWMCKNVFICKVVTSCFVSVFGRFLTAVPYEVLVIISVK